MAADYDFRRNRMKRETEKYSLCIPELYPKEPLTANGYFVK